MAARETRKANGTAPAYLRRVRSGSRVTRSTTLGKNGRMRRVVVLLVAATASATPAPAGSAARPVPVVVLDGRGWGHGVGMAQDGAYWMGRTGASTTQILSHFYRGTRVGRAGGEVRVGILAGAGGSAVVGFPTGGEIRDARDGAQSAGFPVRLPAGSQARLRFDGRAYSVEVLGSGSRRASVLRHAVLASSSQPLPGSSTTTTILLPIDPGTLPLPAPLTPPPPSPLTPPAVAPSPTTTAPPATTSPRPTSTRRLWAVPSAGGTVAVPDRGQRYRGVVEAGGGDGTVRLVNHVDVEQYLRGMGEVRDPSWPPASLRAQAIAARTYALRAVGGGGELCDTQQCQVYLGADAEYAAMDRAVTQTRGQVVMAGRALAATVYSANAGGATAATEEGFGTPGDGYPYLRPAPYPTQDTMSWTVRVALAQVGSRLGYRGRVTGVRVTASGPSGRALQVTIDGARGPRAYSGLEFRRRLGIRSTLFTTGTELGPAPPPPPPAEGGPAQALPGQAAMPATAATGEPGAPAVGPRGAAAGSPAGATAAVLRGTASTSPAAKVAFGALAWLLLLTVVTAQIALGRRRTPPAPRT